MIPIRHPRPSTVPILVVNFLLLALSSFGAVSDDSAATGRSEYDARPGPAGPAAQASYVADNPANDMRLTFSEGLVRGTSRTAEPAWWFTLELAGVGDDGGILSLGRARPHAESNRVDYAYERVRESYVNSEGGLELGFTIAWPPKGRPADGDDTLTLDLALRGNLTPIYTPPSYFVDLVGPGGEPVLRYGDVRATSVNGVILPVRLEIRPAAQPGGPATVRILVEASEGAYPITVNAGLHGSHPRPVPVSGPGEGGSGEIVGNPMTLEPGITDTVEQIMERERLTPMAMPTKPRETHHELELEEELQEDPNAPEASTAAPTVPWTPETQALLLGPPSLPQSVGTSFKGIGIAEAPFIPPDTMGDVGPTQIVMHSNGRIRTFTKLGVADGALNATDTAFWASVAPGGISDPEVRYDRLSGRWFLLAITVAEVTNNKIVLAVSSGPTIASSASFTFYSFSIGTPAPADSTSFCDYPSLGVDANALYTGCNMFSGAGAFRWTSAFVIRKTSVLGGGPIVVTGFPTIATTASAGPYSPRGVDNDDPTATEGYIIGTDPGFLNRINIRRVSTPGGTPTLGANVTLAVLNTNMNTQPASGSTTAIDPSDVRLFTASIRKNKLTGATSLWTAQSLEVTPACVRDTSLTTRRIGAKWYEIGSLTTTPTIAQQGTLCNTAGGAPLNSARGFLYPTVTQTGQGHMALSSSFASAAEFAGVASAGRLRTDPVAGTRAPETIVQTGLAAYTLTDGGGRNRWGDYSFTDVDPNDDQTVWTFQEYADLTSTCPFGSCWSVRAVQLKAPPPPALASATPVCAGLASTVSTITGTDSCAAPTCTNGLCTGGGVCPEFFDPGADTGGPGFANHLSATATGGVTVNAFPASNIVIPGSPSTQRVLQATLSLNTIAATPGAKDLTITNPDGQAVSGIGILTVNATPTAPTASNSGPICELATLQLSASTVPDATYSWTGPGGFTSGVQNPSIAAATAAASGIYSVTVTVAGCTSIAATTTATVTANGGGCDDGNACTLADSCQAGSCGGSAVVCTPLDDCHVAGICDTGSGLCSNPAATDGTTCSDGNACTQVDTCTAGICNGTSPVVCTPLDDCHVAGVCDTGSGLCSNPTATDGTACSDGNACTQVDTCTAGTCNGTSPVVCTPLDDCHVAGTCDTGTGLCSNPAATDGTTCSDGNACTQVDTCMAGICNGTSPVVCTPLDDCHVAGTCDTGTGLCSNPAATDGTACSDGNACTQVDTCTAGICNGTSPVVCPPLDDCHVAGTCDTGTGICSNPIATDGTMCSDGNPCTSGEACAGGVCSGGAPIPPPAEATGVAVDDAAIAWDSLIGAVAYDVVRGSITVLHTGGFSAATEACLADDIGVESLSYTDAPAAGQSWWYLVRGIGACGVGTYDSVDPSQIGPRDAGIQASATPCP